MLSALIVAAASANLDATIDFGSECETNPASRQMLSGMLHVDADGRVRGGRLDVDASLRSAFGTPRLRRPRGRDDVWQASVPVRGTWRCLRVTRISTYLVPGTGVNGFELEFRAPLRRASQALERHGFRLAPGRTVDVSRDGMSVFARLSGQGTRSSFSCGT